MNRREAIAALTALPNVAHISVAKPDPEDVIVIESDGILSREAQENIKVVLTKIWPGRQIVVFERGLRMRFAKR